MMPKSSIDNAIFTIKDPILQHVLTFLDCFDIPETTYVTVRSGVKSQHINFFLLTTIYGSITKLSNHLFIPFLMHQIFLSY